MRQRQNKTPRRLLLPALLLALLLTACGEGGPAPYTTGVVDKLLEAGVFSGEMEPVDGDILTILYGMDEATVTEAAGCLAIDTSVSADEVAVFVLTDESAAAAAEEACRARIRAQIDSYTTYCPDQVPRLEKAVVSRVGNTVLMAVGDLDRLPAAVDELSGSR